MNPSADQQRAVVTGVGMVSPLGPTVDSSWRRLLNGETAARELDAQEIDEFDRLTEFLGQIPSGAPATVQGECSSPDPLTTIIRQAAAEALADAGEPLKQADRQRVACVIGTSKGSLRSLAALTPEAERDFDFRCLWPSQPATCLASDHDIRGPVLAPVAACATGLVAVQRGVELIRRGDADLVIAGSVDASLCSSVLASFRRLGVLSRCPQAARSCKPFDEDRDGFVVGEGGAAVILESAESARRRGARCYAEVLAAMNLTDPTGLTQIDTAGTIVAELIRRLMLASGLPHRPDFINAHGTGTIPNDLAEARGIATAFGRDQPLVTASKGATGHLLGAASSVELGFAIKSIQDQKIPPIRNLENVDTELQVHTVRSDAQTGCLSTVLKLSLGFGGHAAGIILRRRN